MRGPPTVDASAPRDTAYGKLIARNMIGVDHDHFLSFRFLHVDIDGQRNTLVREGLVDRSGSPEPGAASGVLSMSRWLSKVRFIARCAVAMSCGVSRTETEQMRWAAPRIRVRPGHNATSMLAADDYPQRRAAFSAAPLWITAYHPLSFTPLACTPTRATVAKDCRPMWRGTVRSRMLTSSFGIRWDRPCAAARGLADDADGLAQRITGAGRLLRCQPVARCVA